jgi:hypothetical protein
MSAPFRPGDRVWFKGASPEDNGGEAESPAWGTVAEDYSNPGTTPVIYDEHPNNVWHSTTSYLVHSSEAPGPDPSAEHVLRVKAAARSGRIVLVCSCLKFRHHVADRFEPTIDHLITIAREGGHA